MHSSKKLIRLAVTGALAVSMFLPSSLAMYQARVKADALYLRESPAGYHGCCPEQQQQLV